MILHTKSTTFIIQVEDFRVKITVKNCNFTKKSSGAVLMRFQFMLKGQRVGFAHEFKEPEVILGQLHSIEQSALFWAQKIRLEIDQGLIDLKTFNIDRWLKDNRWTDKDAQTERSIAHSVEQLSLIEQIERYLIHDDVVEKKGYKQEFEKLTYMLKVFQVEKNHFDWSQQPITKLKSRHFDDYVAYRTAKDGVAQATIKRELSIISKIYKMQARLINNYNPVVSVISSLKSSEKRTRRFQNNSDERNKLERAILRHKSRNKINQNDAFTIYKLALSTGMRQSEILNIRKSDIDLKKGMLHLPNTKNNEDRYVPLRPAAIEELQYLIKFKESAIINKKMVSKVKDLKKLNMMDEDFSEEWDKLYRTTQKDLEPEFFNRKIFSYSESGFKSVWQRIVKDAGLNNFKFHDLRHEAISNLFENTTMRDQEIMAIVGHKDHQSTKRYLKFRTAHLRKAIAVIDEHDEQEKEDEIERISRIGNFDIFKEDPFVLKLAAHEQQRSRAVGNRKKDIPIDNLIKYLYRDYVLDEKWD